MINNINPLLGKIHNVDCLDFMRQLPDKCVDLVLTDPPYNVGLNYCNGDNRIDYPEWSNIWYQEAKRISNCVLFTPGMVNQRLWMNIDDFKFFYWIKNNQNSPSRLGGFNCVEPFFITGKPQKRIGQDFLWMPIALQQDIGDHPCPKFLPAWKHMVDIFSLENSIVFDPFMGSGTTALSCELLKRKWFGCELEPKYCEIANKRIEAERNQLKLF